jgi:hypothetical protein
MLSLPSIYMSMLRGAIDTLVAISIAASLYAQSGGSAQSAPADSPVNSALVDRGASTSPVSILDDHLPMWMQFDGQFRDRFEGQEHLGFGNSTDNYNLTQLRVLLTITPSDWIQIVGETQDSRIFFKHAVRDVPPYQNTWDVRQAYIQLGKPSKNWFDVVAGREILAFGDERLIGPADWINMGRTFDLVRLNLHHSWFGLALFASSVIIARDGVVDHHYQGNNLHGAYGSLKRIVPRATVEPFVLWRLAPARLRLSENGGLGSLNEVTGGARIEGQLPFGFEYGSTMARQGGSLGSRSIVSWAGHWHMARQLGGLLKFKPFLEANYASGTHDPGGTRWTTFDQIYPSAHDKLDFADQVGWRNIEQVRGGISESAGRTWTFHETYEEFWLASARDSLYASSGAPIAQSPNGTAGRHVGGEFDFWAGWKWKNAIDFGFGAGRFFTGRFLNRTKAGKDFTYPFVYITYEFTRSTWPAR